MASTLLSPMVDYYNDEEELDSVDDDDDRSFRGRDSEEGDAKRIDSKLRLNLLVGNETGAQLLHISVNFRLLFWG